jgi:hypothetical protein
MEHPCKTPNQSRVAAGRVGLGQGSWHPVAASLPSHSVVNLSFWHFYKMLMHLPGCILEKKNKSVIDHLELVLHDCVREKFQEKL